MATPNVTLQPGGVQPHVVSLATELKFGGEVYNAALSSTLGDTAIEIYKKDSFKLSEFAIPATAQIVSAKIDGVASKSIAATGWAKGFVKLQASDPVVQSTDLIVTVDSIDQDELNLIITALATIDAPEDYELLVKTKTELIDGTQYPIEKAVTVAVRDILGA